MGVLETGHAASLPPITAGRGRGPGAIGVLEAAHALAGAATGEAQVPDTLLVIDAGRLAV